MRFVILHVYSLLTTILGSTRADLQVRQDCAESYTLCQPAGATKTSLPGVGSALAPLYADLLDTVKAANIQRCHRVLSNLLDARDSPSVCCVDGTACLAAQDFLVPLCYDHFTTNFFLPDGTYGTLDDGTYHAADGSTANLINGSYVAKNGQTGNIYGSSAPPQTANLPILTPYTAAGVGSAIPVTALGGVITFTTTIPGTTILPTTIPASTIIHSTIVGHSTAAEIVVSTEAASTIIGTTIPPTTIVVTTVAPSSIGARTTSTGAAACIVSPAPERIFGACALGVGIAVLATG